MVIFKRFNVEAAGCPYLLLEPTDIIATLGFTEFKSFTGGRTRAMMANF